MRRATEAWVAVAAKQRRSTAKVLLGRMEDWMRFTVHLLQVAGFLAKTVFLTVEGMVGAD